MSTFLEVLGALGGGAVFITICATTIRAIFRQISATEKNTTATNKLTASCDALASRIQEHEVRLVVLEDHDKNHARRATGGSHAEP